MVMIVLYLDLQLPVQSVPYHHEIYEFESHSWRGVLDTTLWEFIVVVFNAIFDSILVISHNVIQHYVTKFVSDLRQVSGFLMVFQFPPPIQLTAMI